MNRKFFLSLLACIALPSLVYVMYTGAGRTNWPGLGLAFFIAGFVYLQPGLIISVIKDTKGYKQVGKGVVLASAILMLLGFSICSVSLLSFY
jgi:hypothetical protein